MIIATFNHYKPGDIRTGAYSHDGREPELVITIYILRTATHQEWVDYRNTMDIPFNPSHREGANYYKVSID